MHTLKENLKFVVITIVIFMFLIFLSLGAIRKMGILWKNAIMPYTMTHYYLQEAIWLTF